MTLDAFIGDQTNQDARIDFALGIQNSAELLPDEIKNDPIARAIVIAAMTLAPALHRLSKTIEEASERQLDQGP